MKIWIKRSLRTFMQTAVGYIAVNVATLNFTEDGVILKSAVIGLGVSAVAAGIAAVMNVRDRT